jgi:hypothetical protein
VHQHAACSFLIISFYSNWQISNYETLNSPFNSVFFVAERTEKEKSQREGKLQSLVRAYEDQIKDLANKIGKRGHI